MKKRILIILLVFVLSLCFNLKSNAAYSESLPVSNSTSYNLLNPEYIKLENGVISYEGKIQYNSDTKYYLGISGVETSDDASVLIETGSQGSNTLNRVKAIKFIFLLDFTTSGGFTSLSNNTNASYFTFSNLKCDALTSMSLDTLKNSMYVRDFDEGSYYSPYVDDTNTLVNKDKAIVTSTDNKLDLDELGHKICINKFEGSASLKDDGGYNTKYNTPGVYTIKYLIATPLRITTESISIYVFKKAACNIEGPGELDFETAQDFEGFYTFQEYVEATFTVTYGDRDVTLEYELFVEDTTEEIEFKDAIQKAGKYRLFIHAMYNGARVDTYPVTITVEDDEEAIEVYFPEVLLSVTTVSTYNDIQLCEELEKTLKLQGLNVSNVCILNSEYSENAGAGEYNVYYSYEIDSKSYFNKAIVKVEQEENNTSDKVTDNKFLNNKLTGASIALISISSVLVILVVGYLIIRLKHKH